MEEKGFYKFMLISYFIIFANKNLFKNVRKKVLKKV